MADRSAVARLAIRGGAVEHVDDQRVLAARHRQVDLGQQFGIEQCAVQRAVELLTPRRSHSASSELRLPGNIWRASRSVSITLPACSRNGGRPALEFHIEEAKVERRVVDDQFGVLHEVADLVGDLGELGLVGQEIEREPVHGDGVLMDVALGVDVEVQVAAGQAAVHQFHAADFDQAVACGVVEAGGFGIENDLSHGRDCKRRVRY
jgi:hypothetical protein